MQGDGLADSVNTTRLRVARETTEPTMPSVRLFPLFLLALVTRALPIACQDIRIEIDTTSFTLEQTQDGFELHREGRGPVPVPHEWLRPSAEVEDEEGSVVSSFAYDAPVTAFSVAEGWTGLHLSSYSIQREGSLQAAAGRDVFLLLDNKTGELHPGRLDLGVTKGRSRYIGCVSALHHTFLLGDIDQEGQTDIGVIEEEISCSFDENTEAPTDRTYIRQPIQWHVFTEVGWRYVPVYDGALPLALGRVLPLIGLGKSPVEFVLGG